MASPFVSTQIAKVDGKPHVFIANFTGLKSKENARQESETGVRIVFLFRKGAKMYVLPFLGEARQIKAELQEGNLLCVIPEVEKGLVVWRE